MTKTNVSVTHYGTGHAAIRHTKHATSHARIVTAIVIPIHALLASPVSSSLDQDYVISATLAVKLATAQPHQTANPAMTDSTSLELSVCLVTNNARPAKQLLTSVPLAGPTPLSTLASAPATVSVISMRTDPSEESVIPTTLSSASNSVHLVWRIMELHTLCARLEAIFGLASPLDLQPLVGTAAIHRAIMNSVEPTSPETTSSFDGKTSVPLTRTSSLSGSALEPQATSSTTTTKPAHSTSIGTFVTTTITNTRSRPSVVTSPTTSTSVAKTLTVMSGTCMDGNSLQSFSTTTNHTRV